MFAPAGCYEDDTELVQAMAYQPSDVSKQVCLYAMMKQYRISLGLYDYRNRNKVPNFGHFI